MVSSRGRVFWADVTPSNTPKLALLLRWIFSTIVIIATRKRILSLLSKQAQNLPFQRWDDFRKKYLVTKDENSEIGDERYLDEATRGHGDSVQPGRSTPIRIESISL
jgi:hypothetical protein